MPSPVQAMATADYVVYGNARYPLLRAAVNASLNGANSVVAPIVGKTILVMKSKRIAANAVIATWESSGGLVIDGPCSFVANGGEVEPFSDVGHFQTLQGEGLTLFLSAGVQVGGNVVYIAF